MMMYILLAKVLQVLKYLANMVILIMVDGVSSIKEVFGAKRGALFTSSLS